MEDALSALGPHDMRTRLQLSPGHIYALLHSAFEARRPPGCAKCRVPLPFLVEKRPEEGSANWCVAPPTLCAHRCDAMIAALIADMASRYDMRDFRSI